MSLIKTYHDMVVCEDTEEFKTENTFDIATNITSKIVKSNPRLIADVESCEVSDSVLKAEIVQIIDEMNLSFRRDEIIMKVMNYMFGYGILQALIEDDEISDIDFPRYNFCIVKRNGKKMVEPICFVSEKEFDKFCKLIIIRNGGVINENDAHARVSDSTYRLRINVTIPPRSVTGVSLSIRKHRQKSYSLEDLQRLSMFNKKTKLLLENIIRSDSRFIICGKGAAGKTTILRALLEKLDSTERILICEKDRELYLDGVNFIIQKIKKTGHHAEESLNQLIKDGLTMSLDGYCIGEIIGDEAWEFIKAGHTNHRVFATIHANSCYDVVERLIMLVEPLTKLSENRLEKLIFESIDYIIKMEDFRVKEISLLKKEGDKLWMESVI